MCGMAELSRGDTVELWIENETGTDDTTLEDVTLCVMKLSEDS
jgi:hypothetical protein